MKTLTRFGKILTVAIAAFSSLTSFGANDFFEVSVLPRTTMGDVREVYGLDAVHRQFEPFVVLTPGCSSSATGDALLQLNAVTSRLISDSLCEVQGLFRKAWQKTGSYRVPLVRRADGWYEILGTKNFLQTDFCLAQAESMVLTMGSEGFGKLHGDLGQECSVRGVFEPITDHSGFLASPIGMPDGVDCSTLEGSMLFGQAEEPDYLGLLTSSYDSNAAFSRTNSRGSSLLSSKYSGSTGDISAYSRAATKPPVLLKDWVKVAYLSVNSRLERAIHPRVLKATCQNFR